MDGKTSSTLWQDGADWAPRQAVRSEGRAERTADHIPLLHGLKGAAVRFGLAALSRLDLIWRFNFSVRGNWLGQPVTIPLVFGNGIQHLHSSERWMYDVLRTLLGRTPGAFVDVGANIGQTLLKVKMADGNRAYYGFEPNPAAVAYLQQLTTRNRFTNVTVFPIGLSDHTAVVTLFLKDDVDPSASIVAGFRRRERYSITRGASVHRGDEVLGHIADLRIGILKIDVEGAELDVIAGLAQTISRDQPFIICEVLPVYDPANEQGRLRVSRQRALSALLATLHYDLYRANGHGAFEKIDDFVVDSDITRSNYLFVPAGRSTSGLSSQNESTLP
jgi:FkbM family methyltransferase